MGLVAEMSFFLVGEVLKGIIDFENGRLFGQKRGYFPLLLRCVTNGGMWQGEACVIWVLIAKGMGLNKEE